MIFRRRGD